MSLFRFVNTVHSASDKFRVQFIEYLKLIATLNEVLFINQLLFFRNYRFWFLERLHLRLRIIFLGRFSHFLSCLFLNTLQSLFLLDLHLRLIRNRVWLFEYSLGVMTCLKALLIRIKVRQLTIQIWIVPNWRLVGGKLY